MMYAVVTQSEKDDQWYAEFKSENHETWYVSEGYPSTKGQNDPWRTGVNSVIDFCERIGATVPVNIKVVDKHGTLLENFEIQHTQHTQHTEGEKH